MELAHKTYSVPDISCDHCVNAISTAVSKIDGVQRVDGDLEAKTVTVEGGNGDAVVAAIDEAGYDIA